MTKTPPLIYIAAPYTLPDPVENTHRVIRIADVLVDLDVIPIVPHLTMLWHLLCPRPYEQWLEYDMHIMARCDAVLRVPGISDGADREVQEAIRLGIPVIRPRTVEFGECASAVEAWVSRVSVKSKPVTQRINRGETGMHVMISTRWTRVERWTKQGPVESAYAEAEELGCLLAQTIYTVGPTQVDVVLSHCITLLDDLNVFDKTPDQPTSKALIDLCDAANEIQAVSEQQLCG